MSYFAQRRPSSLNINEHLNKLKAMTDNGRNLTKLIEDPDTAQRFLVWLEALGHYLQKRIEVTQIRKTLERIRKLYLDAISGRKEEKVIIAEAKLIAALFAYDAGRHPQLKDLYKIIRWVIDNVKSVKDIVVLKQLAEGIIAFHRFYGGK